MNTYKAYTDYASFKQNKRELGNCSPFCNFAYSDGLMLACFTVSALAKTTAFLKAKEDYKEVEIEAKLFYCIHWVKISFKSFCTVDWLLGAKLQQWNVQLMLCVSVEHSLQELSEQHLSSE